MMDLLLIGVVLGIVAGLVVPRLAEYLLSKLPKA